MPVDVLDLTGCGLDAMPALRALIVASIQEGGWIRCANGAQFRFIDTKPAGTREGD